MKKKYYILIIILILAAAAVFIGQKKGPELTPLMKSDVPLTGIERAGDKFVLTFMRTFVERDGNITTYFGEGKISVVRVDPESRSVEELWNLTLGGYRIFSLPYARGSQVLIAEVGSPNSCTPSELLEISLDGYEVRKIAVLRDYILKVNAFRDGSALLTGFDASRGVGKVVILRDSSKVFEKEMGNKTIASLILDVNGDNREDFIVSSLISNRSFVSIFLNSTEGFEEVRRIEVPGMIWDMKLVELGGERIALFSPKSVYLLDPQNGLAKVFESEEGYYLLSVEAVDIDRDGFDEFFGIYHNATRSYFVELKYSGGSLSEVLRYPLDSKCFAAKWAGGGRFLVGAIDGLYLLSV